MGNIYYKLEHTEYGLDWEHIENFFFLDETKAKQYEEKLKQNTTCDHFVRTSKITFEELKELATVAEFEELFDTVIKEPSADVKSTSVFIPTQLGVNKTLAGVKQNEN